MLSAGHQGKKKRNKLFHPTVEILSHGQRTGFKISASSGQILDRVMASLRLELLTFRWRDVSVPRSGVSVSRSRSLFIVFDLSLWPLQSTEVVSITRTRVYSQGETS
ncbi:hypothetical protein OPV22_000110 [Ensete ventricosum]|uniref:Uncharacterized protein n=1 Tax=Ensete ventricosum TaxID=4639 RepID=A0AAV8Q8B5_ENSVE|nr:hypothetical protein OPV22_000110 [Ensete ventricosum]